MSHRITIQPSGHEFTANEGETILDAALRNDIAVPYGCRSGKCGTCQAKLLDGQISYPWGQPDSMDAKTEQACLTCSSVAETDLTLELDEIEEIKEIEVKNLPCKVDQTERLAHDVIRLFLKLPDDQRLQFLAGQYLDFILEDGRKRAFSIANAPHDDARIELHIRHVDGGEFTDYVFNEMPEKTILRIEAPLGSFYLREKSDRPLIFMSGGTGFAPLKAIIEHAFHIGDTRPIKLYWGVRAQQDLYMPDLPQKWADERDNVEFIPVLSEPDEGWTGRTGWVHEAVLEDNPDISRYDLYMSGPPIMVNAGKDAFLEKGLTLENMFSDAFEYAADTPKKENS